MEACTNDLTPIIVAIASLLTVQVPLIISVVMNQYKIKHDVAVSKSLNYTIDRKTDKQTVILENGFHGPPGPQGPPGPPGQNHTDGEK